MSSNYRVLCLSHDPAIIARDHDFNRPEQAEAAIRDGIEGHEHCDLAIGRYSYPLVEFGCPATRDQSTKPRCIHSITMWTEKGWLLLLAAAYQSDDPEVRQAAADGRHHCLPWERLQRLRVELDITVKEQP